MGTWGSKQFLSVYHLAVFFKIFTAAVNFQCTELNTAWDSERGGRMFVRLFVRPDQSSADGSPPGVSRFEIRSIGQFSEHQSQV